MALAYRSTLLYSDQLQRRLERVMRRPPRQEALYYPATHLSPTTIHPLVSHCRALTNIVSDAVFAGRLVVWTDFSDGVLVNAILRRLETDWVASGIRRDILPGV